jgi:hypothetical protein
MPVCLHPSRGSRSVHPNLHPSAIPAPIRCDSRTAARFVSSARDHHQPRDPESAQAPKRTVGILANASCTSTFFLTIVQSRLRSISSRLWYICESTENSGFWRMTLGMVLSVSFLFLFNQRRYVIGTSNAENYALECLWSLHCDLKAVTLSQL